MKRLLKIVAIPAVMLVGSLVAAPSSAQAHGWGGYGYYGYGYRPSYNYNYYPSYGYSYYNYYPSYYYGGFCY
jgi:hypothetical protein